MTTNNLKKLKSAYLEIKAPMKLRQYGWQRVAVKISTDKNVTILPNYVGRWFTNLALALIVLLFLFGAGSEVKASIPGSRLYPIKVLVQKIIKKVALEKAPSQEITIKEEASLQPTNAPLEKLYGDNSQEQVDTKTTKEISPSTSHTKDKALTETLQKLDKVVTESAQQNDSVNANLNKENPSSENDILDLNIGLPNLENSLNQLDLNL